MGRIIINRLRSVPVEKQATEFVERKGLGHPDTICDYICEAVAHALEKHYLSKFGTVLHYNVDKALLVGGISSPRFGGGKVLKPIKIYIAGRATNKVGNVSIPVDTIAVNAARKWLSDNCRYLKSAHYMIIPEICSGALNLQDVFKRKNEKPIANDTSFGTAHAPFSRTEKLVLQISNLLCSKNFLKQFPAIGEDTKVMAIRIKNKIHVTVAIAFVDKYVKNISEYFSIKDKVQKCLQKSFPQAIIEVNTLDDKSGKAENSVYLTVTGLSAESGDDGNAGRGNRYNGLITPSRPMSLESYAGKNMRHPGKRYQILAQRIANKIASVPGIEEVEVQLVTQIGKSLDKPLCASIGIRTASQLRKKLKTLKALIKENLDKK